MSNVSNGNNFMELDSYGYLLECRLDEQLTTSRGVVDCVLRRKKFGEEMVIEADLYQRKEFLGASFTSFSSAAYLCWDGCRYRIIDIQKRGTNNPFWMELERLISNLIVVNE